MKPWIFSCMRAAVEAFVPGHLLRQSELHLFCRALLLIFNTSCSCTLLLQYCSIWVLQYCSIAVLQYCNPAAWADGQKRREWFLWGRMRTSCIMEFLWQSTFGCKDDPKNVLKIKLFVHLWDKNSTSLYYISLSLGFDDRNRHPNINVREIIWLWD